MYRIEVTGVTPQALQSRCSALWEITAPLCHTIVGWANPDLHIKVVPLYFVVYFEKTYRKSYTDLFFITPLYYNFVLTVTERLHHIFLWEDPYTLIYRSYVQSPTVNLRAMIIHTMVQHECYKSIGGGGGGGLYKFK